MMLMPSANAGCHFTIAIAHKRSGVKLCVLSSVPLLLLLIDSILQITINAVPVIHLLLLLFLVPYAIGVVC